MKWNNLKEVVEVLDKDKTIYDIFCECPYEIFETVRLKKYRSGEFRLENGEVYDKFFVISDKKNSEKIKYWKLHRIYETEEFFYLYINKDHAFLLDKSTFTKGNTSEFLKFLRKKIWCKVY